MKKIKLKGELAELIELAGKCEIQANKVPVTFIFMIMGSRKHVEYHLVLTGMPGLGKGCLEDCCSKHLALSLTEN